MLVHSFPALPEDGMTATYQRDRALAREDMHYLTWEHPLVSGAMDLVLSGEFGNTAFCTLKLPPLKPGTILLEAVFYLSCIAPGDLQLQRYLPLTTIRLVVDSQHNDLSQILSITRLNRLAKEAPLHNSRELVRHARPQITAMLAQAEQLAAGQAGGILDTAATSMRATQHIELQRLQALAAVNPNIRAAEIQHLEGMTERLQGYIEGAQLRLDAIRVAMVTE
jgi:ATP-dependent helicase HepA